ncbi:MAG: nitroreductase [Clostridiales bacterium]|jgi:nitroreductase|nr:nitroreductase [Clostridiales bacterium]
MGMEDSQYFEKPIIDVIKSRHSVRTYKYEKLSEEIKRKLINYSKKIESPFDAKVRLELIDELKIAEKGNVKIGTYGIIKGTSSYITGALEKGDNSLEMLGYCLEKLVLYGTSLGLGTCWLGGTFKRSQFSKMIDLKENELLPIVIPIGYEADKKSLVEAIMRRGAGSDNRKTWNELFYNGNFETSLDEKSAGSYSLALEMVRLAPSASNKQPWRILKQDNYYHFYMEATKGYGKALGFNIQKIDMGIAMCHFEMTLVEAGIEGHWEYEYYRQFSVSDENIEYIASWLEGASHMRL